MSSISNLPYGKVLDYWYEKLRHHPFRNKFLLTKLLEVIVFKFYGASKSSSPIFEEVPLPQRQRQSIPENPTFSLVIPVFLRTAKDGNKLEALFQSIKELNPGPDHVIVVDDSSPIKFNYPKNFHLIEQEQNLGPAAARNAGKNKALEFNSEVIGFTDSDCLLTSNWVSEVMKVFSQDKFCSIISGHTRSFDKNWFGKYHDLNGTLNGRKFKESQNLLYGTTANLAIGAPIARVLDFNEHFPSAAGEDIEFCVKAILSGFAIRFNPQMVVFHNYGYNKNILHNGLCFFRQFKRYGEGERRLLEVIPGYYHLFDQTEEIVVSEQNEFRTLKRSGYNK